MNNSEKKNITCQIVDELGKINLNLSALKDSKNAQPPPRNYLNIVYKLSSIAMFFVVLFGYVYTVIPIYQKEKLAEDLAQIEKNINLYEETISNQKIELKNLNEEKIKISKKTEEINHQKEIAVKNLDVTNKNLEEVISKSQISEKELVKLEAEYYELYKRIFIGDYPINDSLLFFINYMYVHKQLFEFPDKISEKLKSEFIQPKEIALKQLKKLENDVQNEKNSRYKSLKLKIKDEYKTGIAANEKSLTCHVPNFDMWQHKFIEISKSINDEKIKNECVDELFRQRIKKENWSSTDIKELKESNFWSEQKAAYERVCGFQPMNFIVQEFEKSWKKTIKPCNDVIKNINQIVLMNNNKKNQIVKIDEFFPSLEIINDLIDKRIKSILEQMY